MGLSSTGRPRAREGRRPASVMAVDTPGGSLSAARGGAQALMPALSGMRREINKRSGPLSFYVDGQGAPVLLVHSINAAASAYEVRPIFEVLKAHRRVYAVDLPGFGFSDRSDRRYDIDLYVDAILDMLDVIAEENGTQPIDALAISLSSEFLARISIQKPDRFRSLAFVTPTGFNRGAQQRNAKPGATREVPGLFSFLRIPLLNQALFDLLVSRRGIRFFLEKTFGSKHIDEGLARYDYVTAHQPGARYAPFAFVSGRLFSTDIVDVYRRIARPVWMPHGTKGDFQDFSGADWARRSALWTVEPMPTGALPHFEQPQTFMAHYWDFLNATRSAADGAQLSSSSTS